MEKICSKCKVLKLFAYFTKCSKHKDGLRSECKDCESKDKKKYLSIKENLLKDRQITKFWRENNKEKMLVADTKYKELNKEKISLWKKEYYKSTKGIFEHTARSAKRRNISFNLTFEYFNFWYTNKVKECYYCNRSVKECLEKEPGVYRLSIERKNNFLGYQEGNLELACLHCNSIKGNFFTEEQMKIIGPFVRENLRRTNEQ